MGYWQTLLLISLLSAIGFRAGMWMYWQLHRKQRGEPEPRWGEAINASWYSVTGAALAMFLYSPAP